MTRSHAWFGPFALLLLACVPLLGRAADPGPISEKLRAEWKLDPFYQKQVDAGVLVVGSKLLSNNALAEAAWIVDRMLGNRPDIIKAMRENKVRVVVMAAGEFTTDVPEHSNLKPKLYWDRRARGLGATLSNPVVSCGEENLLGYAGDPYPKENIFVHEFAHAIHGTGLVKTDPMFDKKLRTAYQAALERGLWKNTYAATNHSEYWAEGVQCWFDDNAPADALHNEIRTRAKLKEYDTELAKLCKEVFGDGDWRYTRPAARKAEDRKHLVDYDIKKLPRFEWRVEPLHDKAKATVQTSLGDFDVDLDAKGSPEAVDRHARHGWHSVQRRTLLSTRRNANEQDHSIALSGNRRTRARCRGTRGTKGKPLPHLIARGAADSARLRHRAKVHGSNAHGGSKRRLPRCGASHIGNHRRSPLVWCGGLCGRYAEAQAGTGCVSGSGPPTRYHELCERDRF